MGLVLDNVSNDYTTKGLSSLQKSWYRRQMRFQVLNCYSPIVALGSAMTLPRACEKFKVSIFTLITWLVMHTHMEQMEH